MPAKPRVPKRSSNQPLVVVAALLLGLFEALDVLAARKR
jgi:hypothetical protein